MKQYLTVFKNKDTKLKAKELDKSRFFTENNVNGYFSKEGFAKFLTPLTEQQARHLDMALTNTQIGCYLNNNIVSKHESKEGEEIFWLRFAQARRQMGPIALPFHTDMQRFFVDYQSGKIEPNFSLEDLMIESGFYTPDQDQSGS